MPVGWSSCLRFALCLVSLSFVAFAATPSDACQKLASITLPHARITAATVAAAGSFRPPGFHEPESNAGVYGQMPAVCRALVTSTPTTDSSIGIEVWLPLTGWNGKLLNAGNGGFAGSFDYREMAAATGEGFATAATDAGHQASATDASWALGHPEKVIDFGYRAVHEMTAVSKILVEHFYGQPPAHAYFDACSDGGREALMEAQRFPTDYDGILAGAPANAWTSLLTAGLALDQFAQKNPGSSLAPAQLNVLTHAALAACDANDGARDGVIEDPLRCSFNPATLVCPSGQSGDTCLTGPQLAFVKQIYEGIRLDNRQIFPGLLPSSEDGDGGWKDWLVGTANGKHEGNAYAQGFFRNMVFEDSNWDPLKTDLHSAWNMANRKLGPVLNSTDPNLGEFNSHGGKLILYHGWLDPAISPRNTIAYFQAVGASLGEKKVDDFVRLYMIPGMRHCVGGPGADAFGQLQMKRRRDPALNMFTALQAWVESGRAPGPIIAAKAPGKLDSGQSSTRTRPLCPFPQVAHYNGSGDPDKSDSYACKIP